MRRFERDGELVETEIDPDEIDILLSLVESLTDLLGGEAPSLDPSLDAFERLAAAASQTVVLDRRDPLIKRLFPDAYGDAAASDDFRRFTEDDARLARLADARVVRDDLEATQRGTIPLTIRPGRAEAWLKTLNALRLSLSVRLGITDATSVDALARLSMRDPRAYQLAVYDWLGEVLESLLDALTG